MRTFTSTIRAGLWAGILLALLPSTFAETWICLGHGWALVKEWREGATSEDRQTIVLTNIPPEADLSSLQLMLGGAVLPLESWKREGFAAAPAVLMATNYAWQPGGPAPCRAASGQASGNVHCRLRKPWTRNTWGFFVAYRIPGIHWQARYQATLRGIAGDENEPASIDLAGYLQIDNPTSLELHEARLALERDTPADGGAPRAHGFLSLQEDLPLADLWLAPPRADPQRFQYVSPHPLDLAPFTRSDNIFVDVKRKPVEVLYEYDSALIPMDSSRRGLPLQRLIVFPNETTHDLGRALPPGLVQIFQGGARARLLQTAQLQHTPAKEEIRIDLGAAPAIRGSRQTERSKMLGVGSIESDFTILLVNERAQEVRVRVIESPPVQLEWNILQAGKPYVQQARQLFFDVRVPPQSEEAIPYRLHIFTPFE